jgi:hypothetical protein
VRWPALTIAFVCSACTAILGLERVSSVDRDSDGIADAVDNCPNDANPDQSDFDHNGAGDACDLCTDGGDQDVDTDGIPDGCDGCIGVGKDEDHDNIDDGCDACIGIGEDKDHDNIDDACDSCIGNGNDADHDGIDDACDTCVQKFVDTDMDGTDDGCDPCVAFPVGIDSDGDGIEDKCDPCANGPQHDEDGDGVFDACDNCAALKSPTQFDSDFDGVGDACDEEPINHELFDAFDRQNPAWFVEGSGWTVANDKLRFDGFAPSYRWLATMTTRFKLEAIINASPTQGPLGIGGASLIAFDAQSSTALNQMICRIDSDGYLQATAITPAGTESVSAVDKPLTTQPFKLQMIGIDTDKLLQCVATDGANITATAKVTLPVGLIWYGGIQAQRIRAQYSYFDALFVGN